METRLKEILELSTAEKILLVEKIWESIAKDKRDEATHLTEAQKIEIDRRLNLYRQGKTETFTWEEVKSSLRLASK